MMSRIWVGIQNKLGTAVSFNILSEHMCTFNACGRVAVKLSNLNVT